MGAGTKCPAFGGPSNVARTPLCAFGSARPGAIRPCGPSTWSRCRIRRAILSASNGVRIFTRCGHPRLPFEPVPSAAEDDDALRPSPIRAAGHVDVPTDDDRPTHLDLPRPSS